MSLSGADSTIKHLTLDLASATKENEKMTAEVSRTNKLMETLAEEKKSLRSDLTQDQREKGLQEVSVPSAATPERWGQYQMDAKENRLIKKRNKQPAGEEPETATTYDFTSKTEVQAEEEIDQSCKPASRKI